MSKSIDLCFNSHCNYFDDICNNTDECRSFIPFTKSIDSFTEKRSDCIDPDYDAIADMEEIFNASSKIVESEYNIMPFSEFKEMFTLAVHMPSIREVIFNGTHTVVKWDDDTTTIVNCIVEDDFNYEVGLAMAISRKYFEQLTHSDTPRAAFLNTIKNARIIEPKEK